MSIKLQGEFGELENFSNSSGWMLDEATPGTDYSAIFNSFSADTHTYEDGWQLADRFPFVIHKYSYYYNDRKNNMYDSLILAQYYQSKHFVEYGKSTKRVIKHAIKMRKFEENYPEELL